jgi:exopolyphosphatase/guanosine-5'-triphosphate,3'-diphosphate pyrophosphatase
MKQRAGADTGNGMPQLGQNLAIDAAKNGSARHAGPMVPGVSHIDTTRPRSDAGVWQATAPTYAALDLGTNNCRLLIARPAPREAAAGGFKIIDSFSRIVRLGEGLTQTGRLGEAAIIRTLEALAICKDKMQARNVTRTRLIATEACRAADNGAAFIAKVRDVLGLELEIVDRETEAHLAATGCASLADAEAESVVLFDIGGGSSEVIWLDQGREESGANADAHLRERIRFWVSLKLGVVSLAERFGGIDVSDAVFDSMIACVTHELEGFITRAAGLKRCGRFHLLGTSGTVTTIAGIFLNLARYDRRRVDGLWMSDEDVNLTVARLRRMSYQERAVNGCIGPERADLVLAGCAILEAIRRAFPAERVRIADRGLREGMLLQLMQEDAARSRVAHR